MKDCENVSRQVGSVMDVEDPIAGAYVLEVSSPGVDRQLFTLEHYRCFIGETIAVRLVRPYEGQRKLKGILAAVEQDEVEAVRVALKGKPQLALPTASADN